MLKMMKLRPEESQEKISLYSPLDSKLIRVNQARGGLPVQSLHERRNLSALHRFKTVLQLPDTAEQETLSPRLDLRFQPCLYLIYGSGLPPRI